VAQPYPHLAELLGGWFHQDFDIEGETVEEIICAFNKSSSAQQRQAVIADIIEFLRTDDAQIDADFIRIFNPDIEPTGFAASTRAFLSEIARHVAGS
jgi:hypothetical protein